MLSTNSWRARSPKSMLTLLDSYIRALPIISQNDVSLNSEIDCYTYEIRKSYSTSGYPNLGKGFSHDEALVSGLMEAFEMCFIEKVASLDWYDHSLFSSLQNNDPHALITLNPLIGSGGEAQIDSIFVHSSDQKQLCKNKSLTNGLASGQSFDDCCIHAIYELIERHMLGSETRTKLSLLGLDPSIQYFIDRLSQHHIQCTLYFRGCFANTVTIEAHLLYDRSLSLSKSLGGLGFGCSGSLTIAVSRAISEAFQSLSLAQAIEKQDHGLGTHLTSEEYGYFPELNNHPDSSYQLASMIKEAPQHQSIYLDDLPYAFNSVHQLDSLLSDLSTDGVDDLSYLKFTIDDLPFMVMRCFSPCLHNSYNI